MKINFDTPLKTLDGKELKADEKTVFTLKTAAVEALMSLPQDDRSSGEEKFKRFQLAEKVYVGGEVDITPEDAATLKERIGKVFGPSVIGPAYKLLNG